MPEDPHSALLERAAANRKNRMALTPPTLTEAQQHELATELEAMPKWFGPFQYEQVSCPQCGSLDVFWGIKTGSTEGSWFDYQPQRPETNTTHHTQVAVCRACKLQYTREWIVAQQNAWATFIRPNDLPIVIAGYPSCCTEKYMVHCQCGHWAVNRQRGVTVHRVVVRGVEVMSPPSVWICSLCEYMDTKMPQDGTAAPLTVLDRLVSEDEFG